MTATPDGLPAGTVRSQLTALLQLVNLAGRLDRANTWTETQTLAGEPGIAHPVTSSSPRPARGPVYQGADTLTGSATYTFTYETPHTAPTDPDAGRLTKITDACFLTSEQIGDVGNVTQINDVCDDIGLCNESGCASGVLYIRVESLQRPGLLRARRLSRLRDSGPLRRRLLLLRGTTELKGRGGPVGGRCR